MGRGGIGRHLHHFGLPGFGGELRGTHLRVGCVDAPHRRRAISKSDGGAMPWAVVARLDILDALPLLATLKSL